jgi:hypothetical protein
MRRSLLVILLLSAAKLYAQNDVFILVDVSGSVKDNTIISQSKQIISNILTGSLNLNNYPGWKPLNIADPVVQNIINGQHQPLVLNGSYVCLMPFGNKDRYKQFITSRINQVPDDVNSFLNQNYPVSFTDDFTYIQIAQAYTAFLAENEKIYSYFIFIITDDLGDQDNTSSQNSFDQQEQDLILSWNNPLFSQVSSLGSIKRNNFFIHIKKVALLKSRQGKPLDNQCELKLLTYPGGKPGQEVKVQSDMITLRWDCSNCKEVTKYMVAITSTDGASGKNIRKDTQSTSYTTKIKNGRYKITVSATGCRSDSTYIQVKTAQTGGLWLVLLLIGAGIAGYFFWKNKQDKRLSQRTGQLDFDNKDEPVIHNRKEEDTSGLF